MLCGSEEPRTAEHLFGRAIGRQIGERRPWAAPVMRADGLPEPVTGGNPLLFTTYACLCSTCNTDRLSRMMEAATPLVVGLARGTVTKLTPADQEVLLRYFERLAYLVEVVTSNFQLTPEDAASPHLRRNEGFRTFPSAYSPEERRSWLLNGADERTPRVFLGRHMGVLGLELECSVGHLAILVREPIPAFVRIPRFHLVIGQLAIELRMSTASMDSEAPPDCYWQLSRGSGEANWPAARNVGYADFWSTHVQDDHIRYMAWLYRKPPWREAHEAEVRAAAAANPGWGLAASMPGSSTS